MMYTVVKNTLLPSVFVSVFGFAIAFTPASADTIVDKVVDDNNFSALEDAVVSQGLVDTLDTDGLTVFAPDNEAFANIPEFVLDLLEDNPDYLTDILAYHVVAQELDSAKILSKNRIRTFGGESVRVNTIHGEVFINSSKLTDLDIEASNGIIHVIDKVLIPNKIYKAAVKNIQEEIKMLTRTLVEVRKEQFSERFTNF